MVVKLGRTHNTIYHFNLCLMSEESPLPPKPKKERTPSQKAKAHAYYLKHREGLLTKLNERYQNDATYREKAKKRYRERYRNDPQYHDKTLQRAKQRYYNRKAAANVDEAKEQET